MTELHIQLCKISLEYGHHEKSGCETRQKLFNAGIKTVTYNNEIFIELHVHSKYIH